MKKRNVIALLLGILSFCTIFIACKSAPEDLTSYYTSESKGGDITLWIPIPEITGSMEEWITQLVHNQITENFINFSPVTVVERSNNLALQEMLRSEGLGFEEDANSSLGYMKTASHAINTKILRLSETNYSVSMQLLHIETNSTVHQKSGNFTANSSNLQQKLIETINELCYNIMERGISVKFTPVGKSLLKNKVDEEILESYESLAKAEHAQQKLVEKQQEEERQIQEEIQRAEAAKIAAEEKALKKAEKKEQRKKTQRKEQLNVAYTNAANHHGIEVQFHLSTVNHLFFGIEAGTLFDDKIDITEEPLSESKEDSFHYNVAGVIGTNFSILNKKLAPYAKAGVGYLNDTRNKGLGFLAGGGIYSCFSSDFLIFFDYTVNYLWDNYFFDKYTIGVGIDVSSL